MELNKKETLEVGGSHYDMPYPPIRLIEELDLPFAEGCILKYLVRYKQKNGLEDLKKALSYIDLILKYRENYIIRQYDIRDYLIDFFTANNITDSNIRTAISNICEMNNRDNLIFTKNCINELMKEYE